MRKNKVYLAGPITGLSYDAGQDWRANAMNALIELDIQGFSPLRQKQYLSNGEPIEALNDGLKKPLSTSKGIVTRDHFDVMSSDALLINVLGAERVSIGTVMEIAWGWQYRKPMVLISEENNIHWGHPFVQETIGYRVETLQDGVDIIGSILLP